MTRTGRGVVPGSAAGRRGAAAVECYCRRWVGWWCATAPVEPSAAACGRRWVGVVVVLSPRSLLCQIRLPSVLLRCGCAARRGRCSLELLAAVGTATCAETFCWCNSPPPTPPAPPVRSPACAVVRSGLSSRHRRQTRGQGAVLSDQVGHGGTRRNDGGGARVVCACANGDGAAAQGTQQSVRGAKGSSPRPPSSRHCECRR